jgi:hypothetical protein
LLRVSEVQPNDPQTREDAQWSPVAIDLIGVPLESF